MIARPRHGHVRPSGPDATRRRILDVDADALATLVMSSYAGAITMATADQTSRPLGTTIRVPGQTFPPSSFTTMRQPPSSGSLGCSASSRARSLMALTAR